MGLSAVLNEEGQSENIMPHVKVMITGRIH